ERQRRPPDPGPRLDPRAALGGAGTAVPRARQARGRSAPPRPRVLVQAQGSPRRMSWWAVDVRIAPERRESIGAWLVARTGHAVEERDDGTLVGFAEDEAAADQLIVAVEREAGAPVEVSRRALE